MAISKLWASRLRSISVEFPPPKFPPEGDLVNRPATRRWAWSVLFADFLLSLAFCPHPHYRHSSSSFLFIFISENLPPLTHHRLFHTPSYRHILRIWCISQKEIELRGEKKKEKISLRGYPPNHPPSPNLHIEKKKRKEAKKERKKGFSLWIPRSFLRTLNRYSLLSIFSSYRLYFSFCLPFRCRIHVAGFCPSHRKTRQFPSLQAAANFEGGSGVSVISVLAFYGVLSFIVKPESCREVSITPLTTPILPPICHTGPPFRQRNNNTRFRTRVLPFTPLHINPQTAIPPLLYHP